MSIHIISRSKDGKRAMVVRHERGLDGVLRSTTHHVRVSGTQMQFGGVNADGKEVVRDVVETEAVGTGERASS